MKRIFTFFIPLLLCPMLFGQPVEDLINSSGADFRPANIRYKPIGQIMNGHFLHAAGKQNHEYTVIETYEDGSWEQTQRESYTTNASGLLTESVEEVSGPNNSWIPESKQQRSYDANGMLKDISIKVYNNGTWQDSVKETYFYNANQKLQVRAAEEWNIAGNTWDSLQREIYEYDVNGNNLKTLIFKSVAGFQTLQERARNEYIYDAGGKLVEEHNWEFDGTVWKAYRYEFFYDSKGQLSERIQAGLDSAGGQWEFQAKEIFSYDANGNNKDIMIYDWNEFAMAWGSEPFFSFVYKYDLTVDRSNINFYGFDLGGSYVNKPIQLTLSLLFFGNDGEYARLYFHYSPATGITKATSQFPIKIYPNPAKNYLNIDISEMPEAQSIELMDMSGKTILQQYLTSTVNQLKLDKLSTGMYLYRISGKEGTSSGKFMVE